MSASEDLTHQAISSYFIGPQAENMRYFKDNIQTILRELEDARKRYQFEGDQVIPPHSKLFKDKG
jgi:5-formaminoimidazole-4-carboxamide-1-beta-D-ribofuranosyl 5'-monophosphate synthetase